MNENHLYEALKIVAHKRRSVRNFNKKKVLREDVEKILDIARTSPYAGGRKDWEIIVVDDMETIHKLKDIVKNKIDIAYAGTKKEFKQMFEDYAKYFYSFETAPLLLIPVYKHRSGLSLAFNSDPYGMVKLDDDGILKSIACVSLMVILAAESLGYNSCFVHGACVASDEIISELSINRNKRVGAIIPIGYSSEDV